MVSLSKSLNALGQTKSFRKVLTEEENYQVKTQL